MDKTLDNLKVKFVPPRKSDDQVSLKREWRAREGEEYPMTPIGTKKSGETNRSEFADDATAAAAYISAGNAGPGVDELYRQPSNASNASKKSNETTSSHGSRGSVDSDRPVIAPAAAAAVDLSDDEGDDEEAEFDEHAFDHPSTYVEQPWIWIPRDVLGLSEMLVNDLKNVGVDASDIGASMDGKGVVEVTRNPPDEAWEGGHDT